MKESHKEEYASKEYSNEEGYDQKSASNEDGHYQEVSDLMNYIWILQNF